MLQNMPCIEISEVENDVSLRMVPVSLCCFPSSNKMHCLKSDMLLTVTSKMINAMNFSKSSSPSSSVHENRFYFQC